MRLLPLGVKVAPLTCSSRAQRVAHAVAPVSRTYVSPGILNKPWVCQSCQSGPGGLPDVLPPAFQPAVEDVAAVTEETFATSTGVVEPVQEDAAEVRILVLPAPREAGGNPIFFSLPETTSPALGTVRRLPTPLMQDWQRCMSSLLQCKSSHCSAHAQPNFLPLNHILRPGGLLVRRKVLRPLNLLKKLPSTSCPSPVISSRTGFLSFTPMRRPATALFQRGPSALSAVCRG